MMSCLAVSDKYISVAKELYVDLFDHSVTFHNILKLCTKNQAQIINDCITDVCISPTNDHVAAITSLTKELHILQLPDLTSKNIFTLPRSASKIRFTGDGKSVLVADKSGDALIYHLEDSDKGGEKILGHLSLLLDILQTDDKKFIITSDRDEKIKVSCYPNTYSIQTYCLGHTEFVNHLELLPSDSNYLLSTSGDGMVKIWNYKTGGLCYNIDTAQDVDDASRQEFVKYMDSDGLEVSTLPIVHCSVSATSKESNLIAIVHHNSNIVFIYSLELNNNVFTHKIKGQVKLNNFPSDVKIDEKCIYVYDNVKSLVSKYNMCDPYELIKNIEVFLEKELQDVKPVNYCESIKLLYKRKFDNVQEYQERKKLRLENK